MSLARYSYHSPEYSKGGCLAGRVEGNAGHDRRRASADKTARRDECELGGAPRPLWHRSPCGGIALLAERRRLLYCAVLPCRRAQPARKLAQFLLNAFDPAGFISLDKPPVAFWLQAASAKLFGFGTASVLLPQLAEGIGSVALLYALVRRYFGVAAGLLAALFLALTPLAVAVDRSNNTESCLILVLLLATWALFRAIDSGRISLLLVSAAFVGIPFNVKMLVAFGVAPIFALV